MSASSRLALAQIDKAIHRVSREHGAVGAVINRPQHTIDCTDTAIVGVVASMGTDRDAIARRRQLARRQLLSDLNQSAMVQSLMPLDIARSLLTS